MNTIQTAVADQDTFLDTAAAELTSAAYLATLGHGIQGSWIVLELDLWRALSHAVKLWGRGER
jgi:hypothetical protein